MTAKSGSLKFYKNKGSPSRLDRPTTPFVRILRTFLPYLILTGFLLLIFRYFKENLPRFIEAAANIHPMPFAFLMLSIIALTAVNIGTNRMMWNALGLKLRWGEVTILTFAGLLLNLVLPLRGGTVLQAVYLKRRYRFLFAGSLVFNVAMHLFNLAFLSFLSLGVLIFVHRTAPDPVPGFFWLVIFFTGCLIGLAVFFFFASTRIRTPIRFLNETGASFSDGWKRLRGKPNVLGFLSAAVVVSFTLLVLQTFFAFKAQGSSPGLAGLIFMNSVSGFSVLVNLTPGGLGIQESLLLLGGAVMRIGTFQIIFTGLLIRFASVILLVLTGLPSLFLLTQILRPVNRTKNKRRI